MAAAIGIVFLALILIAANQRKKKEKELLPSEPKTPELPPRAPPPPPKAPPPGFSATSPGQPTGKVPTPELQAEIDRYLNMVNNPLVLLFFADVLEERGYQKEADQLRAKAQRLQGNPTGVVAGVGSRMGAWPEPPNMPQEFSSWVKQFAKKGKVCCVSCAAGGDCEAECLG